MGISQKQRSFIEAFTGEQSEELLASMRLAGFSGNDTYLRASARKMLDNPTIIKAITTRDEYRSSQNSLVASRLERQAFWSDLMRNEDTNARPEYDANGLLKKVENIPLTSRMNSAMS